MLTWTFRQNVQVGRVHAATPPPEATSLSFKAILRKAVLTCLGKGTRGPFLEEGGAGEGLRLNPGGKMNGNTNRSIECASGRSTTATGDAGRPVRGVVERDSPTSATGEVGPLVATKTILVVKGRWRDVMIRMSGFDRVGVDRVLCRQVPSSACWVIVIGGSFMASRPSRFAKGAIRRKARVPYLPMICCISGHPLRMAPPHFALSPPTQTQHPPKVLRTCGGPTVESGLGAR